MFGYAPQPFGINEQLALSRQHAAEWKTMLGAQLEAWRELENQHQQEHDLVQSGTFSSNENASAMMTRHLQELLLLEGKNENDRNKMRTFQAEQKADLNSILAARTENSAPR